MKKVSVIIPVYNVEEYVSQCLESISNQTYQNLEIIIVYDRCQDRSLEICQEWEKRDSRIKIIINENRCGLGAARNRGLKSSTGDYIMYLDSDDWCETYFVSKLVDAIESNQVDYASYSGAYWETKQGMELRHTMPVGIYSTNIEKEIIMVRDYRAVWRKIYRREWLLANELFQPEIYHYEDNGYHLVVVPSCVKIEIVSGAAVHYRISNDQSLSKDTSLAQVRDLKNTLEFGVYELKKRDLFSGYKSALGIYFLTEYVWRKKIAENERDDEALCILEETKKWLLDEIGLSNLNINIRNIAYGSFAAKWIMQRTGIYSQNIEHFGFTSLISAMTAGDKIEVKHPNSYRKQQIENDLQGKYLQRLKEIEGSTVIFMDFLDERNGVWQGDTYIADSEAYNEIEYGNKQHMRKINFESKEFHELWKMKCAEMIKILADKRELIKIYLIRSRMALIYGNLDEVKEFNNQEELKKINLQVEDLEKEFLSMGCDAGVTIIPVELPDKYLFTDEEFQYGCFPYYMNNLLYTYVSRFVFKNETEHLVY